MQSLNCSSPRSGDGSPTGSQISELSSDKGSSTSSAEHPRASSQLMEYQETESKVTRWTDEKHSLYLKSMEASFVDQLYNSLDMLGWSPNEECSADRKVSNQKHNGKGTPTPSGQFKVFRDGSWARINFRKETTQVVKVKGPGTFLANPWIKHYKSSCRRGTRISPAFQEETPLATDSHLQLDRQDSVGSNAEVTDQNFVDEVSEEDKSNRIRRRKYRKTTKTANSDSDQVVPSENLSLIIGSVGEDKETSKRLGDEEDFAESNE